MAGHKALNLEIAVRFRFPQPCPPDVLTGIGSLPLFREENDLRKIGGKPCPEG